MLFLQLYMVNIFHNPIKKSIYYAIRFFCGLFGYVYLHAGYTPYPEITIAIYDENHQNIAFHIQEAILKRNGSHAYGLIRRVKLDENGYPYVEDGDALPAFYWQVGKFTLVT